MNETLYTKFGTAKVDKHGYYTITTNKEGNHKIRLHRLIFEDFYNCEIPKGYVIHHKNEIKTDNCILNLKLMRDADHRSLHNEGENHYFYRKHHSDEAKNQISINTSKTMNTTGYYRVSKQKDPRYKQGFAWVYTYIDVNGEQKAIKSVDIKKLEEKVKACGLKWLKFDEGGD